MEQPADPLQSAHAGHGEMHEPAAVSPSPADHMSDDGTCDMSQTCKSCNLLQLDLASTRTFLGASPTLHWADGD
ncbi:hypothetical protein FGD73_22585, partial [Escherichia coli]|uniref:hypothetical protein n=2 Tax=Gammaproteobacteria TaxID=1236 RepID=UPI00110F2AAC